MNGNGNQQQVDIQDVVRFYQEEVAKLTHEKVVLRATLAKVQSELNELKSK